ncbi:YraN family protein [Candidatus Parcubacteria bacterium]|nr:MAG: YraN family protein [Candidatus Parcubacteria bacterium]
MTSLSTGKIGEEKAAEHLKKLGYKIVSKNFRTKLGEIDIIALEKEILIFVEVKTRTSLLYGHPADAVTAKKLRSLIKACHIFLSKEKQYKDFRIDVLEVFLLDTYNYKINHIKNITI